LELQDAVLKLMTESPAPGVQGEVDRIFAAQASFDKWKTRSPDPELRRLAIETAINLTSDSDGNFTGDWTKAKAAFHHMNTRLAEYLEETSGSASSSSPNS
jgi:hypothetical protein